MGLIVAVVVVVVVVVTTIVKKGTPSFRRVLLQVNSNFGEEKKTRRHGLNHPKEAGDNRLDPDGDCLHFVPSLVDWVTFFFIHSYAYKCTKVHPMYYITCYVSTFS